MICARRVFRCFKILERWGNKITGAAGPYFVACAVILITLGTISFFDVIAPTLSYPALSIPICVLIALNLHLHYFYVITVKPGFIEEPPREPGSSFLWARRRSNKGKHRLLIGSARWVEVTPATLTKCLKCKTLRPERSHHCRICNKCVLKYDHHCPCKFLRVNQCVGLHNERHFVLFMAYLVIATFSFCLLGSTRFFDSLGITYVPWEHRTPEVMFALMYILSGVLCFAVGVMLSYHFYGIMWGETSVEAQDHQQYRNTAKARNDEFVNSYDLGKVRNFQFFFNVGESGYPLYTLVFPLRINPYTDGYAWARREGYERHHGLKAGEELTDEEEDDA